MQKRSLLSLWGGLLVGLGALSFMMSLIALSQPLYMLNLYDRVLSSQSVPTLLSLTAITLFLLFCFGGFDWARFLIQKQMGSSVSDAIRPTLLELSIREAAYGVDVQQRLSRLDELRGFVTSQAFTSLFDLVFVPVYFTALFLFHQLIGFVCLFFAFITVLMALIPEWTIKRALTEAWMQKRTLRRHEGQLTSNAGELVVLGGVDLALTRFLEKEKKVESSSDGTAGSLQRIQTMNKVLMMMIQTAVLGLACYLVIHEHVSTSVMFAVNIVASRAMSPLFNVTSSFKSLSRALTAWSEISESLISYKKDERALQPLRSANLRLRSLTILDRNEDRKILQNISMDVDPGELVVVTGSSGAGKSTLLKAAVGLLPDYVGSIELDNRELKHWRFHRDHAFIGYLPQDVRLFTASIAENIALFAENIDQDSIIRLCEDLGLHDEIAALKDGYQTQIKAESPQFSGGQLRLLGLARALYGNPKLLVLDEPTSGLDFEREMKILELIRQRQEAGTAILVASHSAHLLRMATKAMWLKWGQVKAYGIRDAVLAKLGMLKSLPEKGVEA